MLTKILNMPIGDLMECAMEYLVDLQFYFERVKENREMERKGYDNFLILDWSKPKFCGG